MHRNTDYARIDINCSQSERETRSHLLRFTRDVVGRNRMCFVLQR